MKARSHLPTPLSVLTYHSIADHAEENFDKGVIDATPAQFDAQLRFVRRFFSVVRIDDVINAIGGNGELPPNPLLITFDDGYRTCLDTALPMLKAHGLPATFFIATHYVHNRRIYWWDRINYLVNNCTRTRATINYPHQVELDFTAREATIATLIKMVKQVRDLDLDRFLDALTEATGAVFGDELERQLADRTIMTWDDVRTLRRAGMDVQSHTRNHRVLQTLDESALRGELSGSRNDLEQQLDEPVRAVAYPVGHGITELPHIRAALDESGYAVGFTNASGVNYRWKNQDRWDIRRLAVDRDASMAMFASSLAVPPLAHVRG